MEVTLEGYYSAAALIGFLAAQEDEPPQRPTAAWAHDMGEKMASEERRRQRARQKRGKAKKDAP